MTASAVSFPRCDPADLVALLSPGQVIGLYEGNQWIDWTGLPAPGLEVLTADRPELLWRIGRDRFHLVVDSTGKASPGALLDCLVKVSRGTALVSARLGALLKRTSRIVAPPLYPQRSSGPFRVRTSGAYLVFRETTLRVVERWQVEETATLTLAVPDPVRVIAALESSFPGLQGTRSVVHLPLRGHYPEEVLGRLRADGLAVTASAVWYRLLQNCPLRDSGM
jgi:hypothetical protein